MDKITGLGAFSALFSKTVAHNLEGIFFSLDYYSIMAYQKVCKQNINKKNDLVWENTVLFY